MSDDYTELGNSSAAKRRTSHRSAQFYVQPTAVSAGSPLVVRRLFEVNSEPHTGARPSVRLCVGLKTTPIYVDK